MAAKRNMSEFVKIKKFVIIAVVYLIFACNLFETGIRGIGAQSTDAVTDSTTDDLNVTDFSTVTDSTAQPAVPTLAATTRATPTQPQSGTLANTDLGPCTCDLTGNACDVNCCCDLDCSDNDRLAFTECLSFSSADDDRLCLQNNIILINNSPQPSEVTSGNLFCIYIDNFAERNYYNVPDLVSTGAAFNDYVRNYAGPSFQSDSTGNFTFPSTYTSGNPIYTVFSTLTIGTLGLPRGLTSDLCLDDNPISYLYDESFSCARPVTNLAVECQTDPSLGADTYYKNIRVIKDLRLFDGIPNPDNTTVPSDPGDLYNNIYTIIITVDPEILCTDEQGIVYPCEYVEIPAPTYDLVNGYCNDTVKQVEYIIEHNGSAIGIVSVRAKFTMVNIKQEDLPITQTFVSTFKGSLDNNPVKRSGNPGYVVGEPLISGSIVEQTDVDGNVQQSILVNDGLTMVKASAYGECISDVNNRIPVVFGEETRSGCFLRVSLNNMTNFCQMLQAAITNALVLDLNALQQTYVAMFGNSAVEKVGDWVQIILQNSNFGSSSPSTQEGLCFSMVLGLHIQVLYSNVGSLSNPQPKLVGISYIFDQPQDLSFRCVPPYCQPGTEALSQAFEVVSSVSFIDVSQPATGIVAEAPIFLAKVPHDFFYPFLSASSNLTYNSFVTLLVYIFSLFVRS